MKTPAMLLFVTTAALLAQQTGTVPSTSLVLGAQMAGGPPVTGSPYSARAITDVTQALADGNRIEMHSSSMRYRDAQGRERREDVLPGAVGTSVVLILDPVSRFSYSLDQKLRTAQRFGRLPPPPPAHGSSLGVLYLPTESQAELLKTRGLDHGALVRETVTGSPAARAGLRSGDVILAVNSQAVRDSADLRPAILAVPTGESVTLSLDRDGKTMDIKVTLEDRSQVFRNMPLALGNPQPVVYAPFIHVPAVDRSTTETEDLGTMNLEGVLAEGKRSTMTIPAGQVGNQQPIHVVSETWYSPDLQTMILIRHSDPRAGDTVYRLTHISRTEPPASLFQVPSDYTVTQAPGSELVPAR